MNSIKKIGHWILFFIAGSIATQVLISAITLIPIFVFSWIIPLNNFLFFIVGGILNLIYNYLFIGLITLYIGVLNKKKPDFWVSGSWILLVSFFSFYTAFNSFSDAVSQNDAKEMFLSFKGICFLITILPTLFNFFFVFLFGLFAKNND